MSLFDIGGEGVEWTKQSVGSGGSGGAPQVEGAGKTIDLTFDEPGKKYKVKAECGSKSVVIFVVALKVEIDHDIWWFNGEDAANYDESGTLTAQGVSSGTFQWDVVAGQSKVTLNNGGADSDSIGPVANDYTVTIKSTDASDVENDVSVQLTYNGVAVCEKELTVYAPNSTEKWSSYPQTLWYPPVLPSGPRGYITTYKFWVLDQIGNKLTKDLEINETFGTFVDDYAGQNWSSAVSETGDTWANAIFWDEYKFYGSPLIPGAPDPLPVPLSDPDSGTTIFNVQQKYFAGSTTPGQGREIKSHKLQVYRGEAKQE